MQPLILILSTILLVACGRWDQHVTSISPSESFRLVVWDKKMGPDSSVRVSLENKAGYEVAEYRAKGDRSPTLTEVFWSRGTNAVGVLVCDAINTRLLIGLDLRTGKTIGPSLVAPGIRNALMLRYRPTPEMLADYGGDVVAWACSATSGPYVTYKQIISQHRILPHLR